MIVNLNDPVKVKLTKGGVKMNEYKIKLAEILIEKDKIINELMKENEQLKEQLEKATA